MPEPGAGGYCQWKGMPVMCGPRGLPTGRSLSVSQRRQGKVQDVSAASGIGKPDGCYGFTVLASDFDNDGYPDLYVVLRLPAQSALITTSRTEPSRKSALPPVSH